MHIPSTDLAPWSFERDWYFYSGLQYFALKFLVPRQMTFLRKISSISIMFLFASYALHINMRNRFWDPFSPKLSRHTDSIFFLYLPECCNLSEDIQQSYWQSLLMPCRKYIQWYISYLIAVTNDWVWRGFYITHNDALHSVGLLLDEWSARLRDLCLKTHNTHNRQTSMPPVGFEPTTPAGERP